MHNCCFIDVVIDDNASSWERGLQQHRSPSTAKGLPSCWKFLLFLFPQLQQGRYGSLTGLKVVC